MRLFFAVALPQAVRDALGRLRADDPAYRWVEPASMHVTLAFLGEQPSDALAGLESIGAEAAAASPASTLRLGQPGSFGPRSAPRVLWIGLAGDVAALETLHRHLSDGLRQGQFPVEDRPLAPHITLARRRERFSSRTPPPWPPRSSVQPVEIPLDELTLFQSQLRPSGAIYTALAAFALGSTTARSARE